jgi:hypothetical protein
LLPTNLKISAASYKLPGCFGGFISQISQADLSRYWSALLKTCSLAASIAEGGGALPPA